MTEWRVIPGYERYEVTRDGRVRNVASGRVLKPRIKATGYVEVTFCIPRPDGGVSKWGKRGKAINRLVHRLVAFAYIPNPEGKREVNHKDLNKQNNHADNLEWMSPRENSLHSAANGALKGRRLRTYHRKFDGSPKPCMQCGTMMERPFIDGARRKRMSTRQWQERQFCGNSCAMKARRAAERHPTPHVISTEER